MNKCDHDLYWRGNYGNCMACRAEKAEAELAVVSRALNLACKNRSAPWENTDETLVRYYLRRAREAAEETGGKHEPN